MPIKYVPSGDKFKASQLWGEGRHQLSILKNLMSFQGLKQDQRLVRFEDGTIIKCLSCFTQDVIEVFVPLAPIGEAPKYEVTTRSNYWPAITAYAGPNYNDEFLGVVLCKGGGFNPPYEFISKDSLPEDYGSGPCEELFKERFWKFFDGSKLDGRYGGVSYQDIVPSGITDADLVQKTATAVDVSAPGGFNSIITGVDREWIVSALYCDHWKYCGKSHAAFTYTRTESLYKDYAFSYLLPGEAAPGYWPEYTYEDNPHSGGRKPSAHILNLSGNLYYSTEGSGGSTFFGPIFNQALQDALKFVDGHWEEDPSINYDTVRALAESYVDYALINDRVANYYTLEDKFAKRVGIVMGTASYSYLNTDHSPFAFSSSVLDDDHYALVYSLGSSVFGKDYSLSHPVSDTCIDLWCNGYGLPDACSDPTDVTVINNCIEGPLSVVVDGESFELFSQSACPTAPRLQEWQVKYFKVNDRLSIGLFCVAKNYNYPFDYMYVYAKVVHNNDGTTEKEAIVTPVDKKNHLIPDVTGNDDEDLYGHWNFRLILETITTIKKVA